MYLSVFRDCTSFTASPLQSRQLFAFCCQKCIYFPPFPFPFTSACYIGSPIFPPASRASKTRGQIDFQAKIPPGIHIGTCHQPEPPPSHNHHTSAEGKQNCQSFRLVLPSPLPSPSKSVHSSLLAALMLRLCIVPLSNPPSLLLNTPPAHFSYKFCIDNNNLSKLPPC